MQQDSDTSPLDLARLLDDAIAEAVSHEDPRRFMDWFRDHVADYETEASDGELLDAAFIAVLGRSIWNALPLPGNGFKPSPLPEPGRNDPCFCGSGEKYKRCCAESPTLPLDPEHILPSVLDHTPAETLARRVRAGRVPVNALVQVAGRRFERGELWNAVDLVEPLFAGHLRRTDEHHAQALELLCDVYTQLGHEQKKDALLERIVEAAERSPLRSDAWQHIAITRLDQGDADGAWDAFHKARQDHPDAPGIGLLEIQLLMSRGRAEEAAERAGCWEERLRRQGFGDNNRLLRFFEEMSHDPRAVMADMGVKAAGGAGERLIGWLKEMAGRPLPDYATENLSGPDTHEENPLRLVPPEAHVELASRWHAVFPMAKSDADSVEPVGPDDPWDPTVEQTWMDFLKDHAEAFDSLDILDDLANALTIHPQYGADWLDHSALAPVLDRSEAIVDCALYGRSQPRLSWRVPDNRPALRNLARRVYLHTRRGEEDAAARAADRVLTLGPDDDPAIFDSGTVDRHRSREP